MGSAYRNVKRRRFAERDGASGVLPVACSLVLAQSRAQEVRVNLRERWYASCKEENGDVWPQAGSARYPGGAARGGRYAVAPVGAQSAGATVLGDGQGAGARTGSASD